MRLPTRKSEQLRQQEQDNDEMVVHLTPVAVQRMQDEIIDLEERQMPKAIEDVARAVAQGDLSENAEYKEARPRLSRIQSRIFALKDRLKRVVLIESGAQPSGLVRLGSVVLVEVGGKQKTYHIVGPRESHPAQGRISHLSPLGLALIGHAAGERISFQAPIGEVVYTILEVK